MADKEKRPAKEGNMFRSLLKFYEQKQYKKALKTADAILKKLPKDGETLAMKGLVLDAFKKKDEAFVLVREGLKNDLRSHICWHVYGLLYRAHNNYEEAIKCYRNALKHDKDNLQILRDLSLLQIQTRDIAGFIETRNTLLQLKPSQRTNWIGLAIAYHLEKSFDMASAVLDAFRTTNSKGEDGDQDFETSELALYTNMIIEESGELEKALEHLVSAGDDIVDGLTVKEKRGAILLKLGRSADAAEQYRELLEINIDNLNYHTGLQAAHGVTGTGDLSPAKREEMLALYSDLQKEYPRSHICRRFPLDFSQGEKFRSLLADFLPKLLRKGTPSLFADVEDLMKDADKAGAIEELILAFVSSLREKGTLTPKSPKEPPSTLLWALFFLTQLYNKTGRSQQALATVDEAIAHTPTVLDLYGMKGEIYADAGAPTKAANLFDYSRSMDLADRYLNTVCTKYLLRADRVDDAQDCIALFTKQDDRTGNAVHDMQCMWYELETGESRMRTREWGKALKQFHWVDKHFKEIIEDQFDFHSYCLRRSTLRTYVEMLRNEDQLFGHPFYVRAAVNAIKVYLELYDNPRKEGDDDAELAGLSAAEKKKLLSKRKRDAARTKEAETKKPEKKSLNKKSKPEDEDPEGIQLAATTDPLGDAVKFLKNLQAFAQSNVDTHLLAVEVYIRKAKFVLALQSVKRAITAAGVDHAGVHRAVVSFVHAYGDATAVEEPAAGVIAAEVAQLLGGKTVVQYNEAYLKKHSSSFDSRIAGAEMKLRLDPKSVRDAVALLARLDGDGVTLAACQAAQRVLQKAADSAAVDAFRAQVCERFPFSEFFNPTLKEEPVVPE